MDSSEDVDISAISISDDDEIPDDDDDDVVSGVGSRSGSGFASASALQEGLTENPKRGDVGPVGSVSQAQLSFIKSVPLFHNLTEIQITSLVKKLRRAQFATGDAIIKQGSVGLRFFVITEGRVAVHKSAGLPPAE